MRNVMPYLLALGLFISLPLSLNAQITEDPDDFSIAGSLAGSGQQAMQSVVQGRVTAAAMTHQLKEARKHYWNTWPDKPGHEEAAGELASLLWQKDLLYLATLVVEGPPQGSMVKAVSFEDMLKGRVERLPADASFGSILLSTLMGGIDEGIPPHLEGLFYQWVMEVRKALGAKGRNDMILPLGLPLAIYQPQVLEVYAKYVRARDDNEYWIGPYSPFQTDDSRQLLAAMLVRGRNWPMEEAMIQVELLEKLAGPAVIEYSVRSMLREEEDPRSVDPQAYSRRIAAGLFQQLQSYDTPDARSWLGISFLPSDFSGLPKAIAEIEALLATYGEERVLAIAEKLNALGRSPARPDYVADYSGHRMETDRWWLEQLLKNPDLPLPGITKPIPIDASHQALLQEMEKREIAVQIVGKVSRAEWVERESIVAGQTEEALRLHLSNAPDAFVYARQSRGGDVISQVLGWDGEKVIGKRIGIYSIPTYVQGKLEVEARAPWRVSILAEPTQTVAKLPPGVAAKSGERIAGISGIDYSELAKQVDAAIQGLSSGRGFCQCEAKEGDFVRTYSVGNITVWHPGYGETRMRIMSSTYVRNGGVNTEAWNTSLENHTQLSTPKALNWKAPAYEQLQGSCIRVRVPVLEPATTVEHTLVFRKRELNKTDQLPYLEFYVTERTQAEQLLSLMQDFVAGKAPSEIQAPQTRDRGRLDRRE